VGLNFEYARNEIEILLGKKDSCEPPPLFGSMMRSADSVDRSVVTESMEVSLAGITHQTATQTVLGTRLFVPLDLPRLVHCKCAQHEHPNQMANA